MYLFTNHMNSISAKRKCHKIKNKKHRHEDEMVKEFRAIETVDDDKQTKKKASLAEQRQKYFLRIINRWTIQMERI